MVLQSILYAFFSVIPLNLRSFNSFSCASRHSRLASLFDSLNVREKEERNDSLVVLFASNSTAFIVYLVTMLTN